jgi:hypothetical protein
MQANTINLHKEAREGTLTKWQIELVACFARPKVLRKCLPSVLCSHATSPQFEQTPLHNAAENGHSEAVQLLLAADSDPNAHSKVTASPAAAL